VSSIDVKLFVDKGPARTRLIELRSEETVVGRRRDCDVCIPSAEVSRRHCMLSFQNGQLTVEDLNSANGTFLNGKRLAKKATVMPGDRLQIGPLTFQVQYEAPQQAAGSPFNFGALADGARGGEEFEVVDDDEAMVLEEAETSSPPAKPGKGNPPATVTESPEELPEVILEEVEPVELTDADELDELLKDLDKK
jgi:predicted component of type VI protein secretion system